MSREVADGSVHLVGTAHVSEESADRVEREIEDRRPDAVAVELDEDRFRQLKGEVPDDLDPADLLRGNTVFQFLAYWLLSYVQARLGDRFDIEPGADMKAGVDTAERLGIDVALVDRDIQTTIRRFWARLTLIEKLKLVWQLLLGTVGLGGGGDVEEFDIEDLTDTDVVSAMMEEFRQFSPGGAEALIDERDAFIAHRLVSLTEEGKDVVAVVGAGHVEGIERYLADPASLPPLETLDGEPATRRFSVVKVLSYLVMVGFVGFFFLLLMAGVRKTFLLKLFLAWFAFNGIIAFSLARLAGAHWPSATVGGLVAWLTSINPLLAPGWFAGYVELRYLTVSIADVNTLNDILADEESPIRDLYRRMLQVPLFRLIVIVAATNVGSFVASVLFPFVVIPWLAPEIGGVDAIMNRLIDGAEESARLLLEALG
ncbi:MAG: TraB/GumN family protein [Halobacteriales archaeon]